MSGFVGLRFPAAVVIPIAPPPPPAAVIEGDCDDWACEGLERLVRRLLRGRVLEAHAEVAALVVLLAAEDADPVSDDWDWD